MNHTATSPTQTARRLSGANVGNHNETLITAQRPRRSGLDQNHNETLIAVRPASGLDTNPNEILIAAQRPRLRGLEENHNETLITTRPAPYVAAGRNGTLVAGSWAWPYPQPRYTAVAPVG
jgi:hypothetical protein